MEIQIKSATPLEVLTGKFRETYGKIQGYLHEAEGDMEARIHINYSPSGVQNRIKTIQLAFESDLRKLAEECKITTEDNQEAAVIYPPFELIQTIANALLKHSDSGESSVNKEARVILEALGAAGYTITKK